MEMATAEARGDVALRLAAVQDRVVAAAGKRGRNPDEITLVAVSKTVPADRILLALKAGVRHLGENRVQEAEAKAPLLPAGAEWHLIGHLQTNKINKALELFSLIHSVDSLRLGETIASRAQAAEAVGQARARVLLQINIAQKSGQFGFLEEEASAAAIHLSALPGLLLDGLMCIAPEVEMPELARPSFRRLANLYGSLRNRMLDAGHSWRHLSMGMTNDYPVAIEEGANLVRVGRAIFGDRSVAPQVET